MGTVAFPKVLEHNSRRMTAPSNRVSFLVVVGIALCLYLPLLSKNYDINGLNEAAAVKAGTPGDLLTPNHMLYRPLGYLASQKFAALGWTGGLVPVLQILSAIFGALGVGFVYLTLIRITPDRAIAFWTTLMLAVSWSYWTLSTDVYYFSLAAMLVAAALALFVWAESDFLRGACGVVAALSVLACQANVFLIPALGVASVIRDSSSSPKQSPRQALKNLIPLWGAALFVLGASFVGVGVQVYGKQTLSGLLQWGSSYSSNPLPMWGAWSLDRLVLFIGSAFKSVVGIDIWMFSFFHRHLHLPGGEVPRWAAPAGFALLVAALIAAYRWAPDKQDAQKPTALWLLLLYAAYVPFIVWWEPMEPRWFIMPNIFLAGFAAIVWSRWSNLSWWAVPALFFVLFGWNLATSAWPKHSAESVPTQTAACVASHMKDADLFLATEWNWAGYIEYVHNRKILNVVTSVSRNEDKRQALDRISRTVSERQQQGGDVYMMDIKVYPPDYMKWLQEQTGLTAEDLRFYSGSPVFDCVYGNFLRLDPLPHGIQ